MDMLTPELRERLFANAAAHHEAMQHGLAEPDRAPVVKFFNPCGAATWLFSELDSDGDMLFGLCDLGFGCPELGSASLAEIAGVTVAFGLKIERDLHFAVATAALRWRNSMLMLASANGRKIIMPESTIC
jgi:hypothetical protein